MLNRGESATQQKRSRDQIRYQIKQKLVSALPDCELNDCLRNFSTASLVGQTYRKRYIVFSQKITITQTVQRSTRRFDQKRTPRHRPFCSISSPNRYESFTTVTASSRPSSSSFSHSSFIHSRECLDEIDVDPFITTRNGSFRSFSPSTRHHSSSKLIRLLSSSSTSRFYPLQPRSDSLNLDLIRNSTESHSPFQTHIRTASSYRHRHSRCSAELARSSEALLQPAFEL